MGDPQHAWDEDRVRQASELGGASGFISDLPEGFDTVLSPPRDIYSGSPEGAHQTEYERLRARVGRTQGPKLSGGQMQKLALYVLILPHLVSCLNIIRSRTFMRSLGDDSDVGLLLFDEPR